MRKRWAKLKLGNLRPQLADVRELAGNDVVAFRVDVTDADGEPVLAVTTTLVGRAEPAA